eukprot:4210565-Alexandrium_andersonii.AAC.1
MRRATQRVVTEVAGTTGMLLKGARPDPSHRTAATARKGKNVGNQGPEPGQLGRVAHCRPVPEDTGSDPAGRGKLCAGTPGRQTPSADTS